MGTQSFELGEFYAAYAHWLDIGAPQDAPFHREYGLCRALDTFTDLMPKHLKNEMHDLLSMEMRTQFVEANLDIVHPFNLSIPYYYEGYWKECHKNIMRVNWVRNRANV